MGTSVFRQAAVFLRERRAAARALAVLLCLAAVVVVVTAGLLSSTGQALTHRVRLLTCSAEAHQHGPACLDEEGAAACGEADFFVHVHNADCYGPDGALSCALEEIPPHIHDPSCWQETKTLVCGLEEEPGHLHGEECYDRQRGELLCALGEHTHDENCYTWQESLLCGQTGEEHVHDESCYTAVQVLSCPLEEHVHGDGCYAWTQTLICATEEGAGAGHLHDGACYETERTLACGQLELHTHTDACRDEEGRLLCGRTELLEHVHGEDCFTVKELNDEEILALYGRIPEGLEEVPESADGFVPAGREEPGPEPGTEYLCGLEEHAHDESCLDENGELVCGLEEHVHDGSCLPPEEPPAEEPQPEDPPAEEPQPEEPEESEPEEPEAEGPEYFCGLEEHAHDGSCLDENGEPVCGLEEHSHGESCLLPRYEQTAEAEGVRVTAAYTGEAGIPPDALLRVTRIEPEGEDAGHYEARLSDLGEINNQLEDEALIPVALLNIGFFREDGTEVAPAAPVIITIQFLDETGGLLGGSLRVVHFAETGPEVLEPPEQEEDAVTFSADGFSDFMVVASVGAVDGAGSGVMTMSAEVYDNFEHKKQIDYLGDNDGTIDERNPDTSLDNKNSGAVTDDLYRLYLDMEGKSEPANLLLIIDRSSSMREKMGEERRDQTLADLLMGKDGKAGILQQFLERNAGKTEAAEKSYAAAVWFGGEYTNSGGYGNLPHYFNAQGKDLGKGAGGLQPNSIGGYQEVYTNDAGDVFSWTDTYSKNMLTTGHSRTSKQIGSLPGKDSGTEGTNYCAGLLAAAAMLGKLPNDNQTVVIFLSDGLPTYFFQASSYSDGRAGKTIWRYGEALEDKSMVCAEGLRASGGVTVASQYGFFKQTREFYQQFKNEFPGIRFFTVGIGTGGTVALRQNSDYLTAAEKKSKNAYPRSYSVMEAMGEGGMKTGNDAAALEKTLREIVFPSGVTITDQLSAYVDFYTSQIDVLVTAKKKDGRSTIELWKGSAIDGKSGMAGAATAQNAIGGVAVVQSVVIADKTITLTFNPNYALGAEYTYTLSFNVQVTRKAYDDYAENLNKGDGTGYGGTVGDRGRYTTDYNKNKTSTEKPGFYSNESAKVSYTIDGQRGELSYDMPVVQVWGSDLTLAKVNDAGEPLKGICFCLQRALSGGKFGYPAPRSSGGKVTGADLGLTGAEADYTFYKTKADGGIQYKLLRPGDFVLYEYVPDEYEGAYSQTGKLKIVAKFTVKKGRLTYTYLADGLETEENREANQTNATYTYHNVLSVTNPRRSMALSIYKKDEDGQALSGAAFELHRASETKTGYQYDAENKTTLQGAWTSGEDGLLFSGQLPFGLYALAETGAPENYERLTQEVVFRLSGQGVQLLAGPPGAASWDGGSLTLTVTDRRIAAAVKFVKVDGSDRGKNLGGAEFALYGAAYKLPDGGYDESAEPIWTGVSQADTGVIGAVFEQLKAGESYYLRELKAPDGYTLLTVPILITVNGDGIINAQPDGILSGGGIASVGEKDGETGVVTLTIANSSGYRLPEAGGPGPAGFYALGLGLLLTGAALLLRRRGKPCTHPSGENYNQKTEERE